MRWDYAFYQMIVETGRAQLSARHPGDVKPAHNNFAGLGARPTIASGVRGH